MSKMYDICIKHLESKGKKKFIMRKKNIYICKGELAFLILEYHVILLLYLLSVRGLLDNNDKLNMCMQFCSFLNPQLNFMKLILFL